MHALSRSLWPSLTSAALLSACASSSARTAQAPRLEPCAADDSAPAPELPVELRAALSARRALGESCRDAIGPEDALQAPADDELIGPDAPAPPFEVTTTDCQRIDSSQLIGRSAFVVVFFSSWCGVCDRKMPVIEAAARALAGRVPFIGVVLDSDETWPAVGDFVARHDVTLPLVRGPAYRRFSLSYNPFGSIPVVVIVGRDGNVLDAQVGYSAFDYNRLVAMADLASRRGSDHADATSTASPPRF